MEGVLEAGTYTFADERDVFVMVDGSIAINFSADSNGGVTSGSEEDITTGTATVSVSGSTYTINYTLNIGNETATGVHTGSLTPVAVN